MIRNSVLISFLFFLFSAFLLFFISPATAFAQCFNYSWKGGFATDIADPGLCTWTGPLGNGQINDAAGTDGDGNPRPAYENSQFWRVTGNQACSVKNPGSACTSGSVTSIPLGSNYTYTCCFPTPTPTPTPFICPAPTNLSCSRVNSTQVQGDWTQSVPVGNYRLRACPLGQPPSSPGCRDSASLTSGSFNFVDVDSSVWDLYAKVENNTGAFCVPPSSWSGPARCPTPTPTLPPPPTDTPTPTPTSGPCPQVSGQAFFDLNDNRNYDPPSEFGVPSTQVAAVPPVGASYPPGSTTTQSNGGYVIPNLCGAVYDIIVTVPANSRMSTGTTNSRRVGLPPSASNINFGFVPIGCQVTTSPSVHNLAVGGTGIVTATVTSGQGPATITQMRFGSYNTSIATVNPTSDSTSIYSTTVTGVGGGSTAVWATADLSDGRTCQSTGATDTDVNVSGATPTPTPPASVCNAVCTLQSCGQAGGAPGVWQLVYTSCGPGCCSLNSSTCVGSAICPLPPPPTPTSPPPPAPTPTPGSCPVGTIEKTVIASGGPSCRGGGSSCSANSQCCSNVCTGAPYFQCAGAPALGSPIAVSYSEGLWPSACRLVRDGAYWSYASAYRANNLGVGYSNECTWCNDVVCASNASSKTDQFAILNFTLPFTLPINTQILSASLRSPTTSSGCEAGTLYGRIGITQIGPSYTGFGYWANGQPPAEPAWTPDGGFGANDIAISFTPGVCQGRPASIMQASCVGSGRASGTGNATALMQSFVNSQAITNVSFKIDAQKAEQLCEAMHTKMAGSFIINSPAGPSDLTVRYCEAAPTPTPVPASVVITNPPAGSQQCANFPLGYDTTSVGACNLFTKDGSFGWADRGAISCGLGQTKTITVGDGLWCNTPGASTCGARVIGTPQPSCSNFLLKWGTPGSGNGQFSNPQGIAVDSSNNVYVADTLNDRIQRFNSSGGFITKWGQGVVSGDDYFNDPETVATDPSGNVYTQINFNDYIKKFTSTGTIIPPGWTFFNNGVGDGPWGIATDPSGNVYVANIWGNRIQKFTSTGTLITEWGSGGAGDGQFNLPAGVAVDSSSNVYVTDLGNKRIQKFTSTGTFLTKWGSGGAGDGQFDLPWGIAVDSSNNVYVADTNNNRIQKFTSTGVFITKWGSLGSGDGQFNAPYGVAVDSGGNIYVADTSNQRVQKFACSAPPPPVQDERFFSVCAPPPNWFQSTGVNMRIDTGFDDRIPGTVPLVSRFASLIGTGGTPGIIFGGKISPDFGLGQASDPSSWNWQAANFALWKQDIYTASRRSVPTSYSFLSFTAQSSGIPTPDISDFCIGRDISNCTLSGLPHGIYMANSDLYLNTYTFTGDQDFIILVKGNLTIKGNITVDPGSTVVFSATGNVIVDKAVTRIEGLYSADRDFKVEGTPLGGDSALNVYGTAVANAALTAGSFVNNRNLGLANNTLPSVKFIERPDFIVNYPDFVKQGTRLWQEVAP